MLGNQDLWSITWSEMSQVSTWRWGIEYVIQPGVLRPCCQHWTPKFKWSVNAEISAFQVTPSLKHDDENDEDEGNNHDCDLMMVVHRQFKVNIGAHSWTQKPHAWDQTSKSNCSKRIQTAEPPLFLMLTANKYDKSSTVERSGQNRLWAADELHAEVWQGYDSDPGGELPLQWMSIPIPPTGSRHVR